MHLHGCWGVCLYSRSICPVLWCRSAVCKLCCVRNWGIGWSSLIMGYSLCSIVNNDIVWVLWYIKWSLPFLLYNMTLLISLIHFACLCSLLYSHSWGYWGWKRYDQSPCTGQRSVVCGWASKNVLWVCVRPSLCRWIILADSSSLTVTFLFFKSQELIPIVSFLFLV